MSERQVIKNLVLLFAFVATAVGAVLVVRRIEQGKVFLSTSSPNGTYVVSLAGRRDRPLLPFITHEVVFSVTKDGRESLTRKYLHSGDGFDPWFNLEFPQHAWVKENVLQFYRVSEGERESIVVENETQKLIKYLRVTSLDSFLLFDIQPGATFTLPVAEPRADLRWIEVEGEFDDGQRIKATGTNFLFRGRTGPFSYYVDINDDGLTIESPGLVKYSGG
jgi:hypothetical protein